MARSNLAEVIMPVQPEVAPTATPEEKVSKKTKKAVKRQTLPLAEKFLYLGLSALLFIAVVSLITMHVSISTANIKLQETNQKIETTQNKSDDYRQNISELTKANRLESIAKKNGLSMIDGNIRNVTK